MATEVASGAPTRFSASAAFTWAWYELPLFDLVNGTLVSYNALVQVDSETLLTVAGEETWAGYDVMVLNGTLPSNAQTGDPGPVTVGTPTCWVDQDCDSAHVLTFTEKPRVTASFGFNTSAPGGMMAPLQRLVVGVRFSGSGVGPFDYTLTLTQLPRVLTDGLVLDSALSPCSGDEALSCRQYFTVPVSGYDIVHLHVARAGSNLTTTDAYGIVRSNGGRGLVGSMYVATGTSYHTPPPAQYAELRLFDNTTSAVEVGYFCTLPAQSGIYVLALIAGDGGGFGPELLESDWTDAEREIQGGISRVGRGRFTLTVRHMQFVDGPMGTPDDERRGCVSFGQTRRYSLRTTGLGDANLYAEVIGANVSSLRARCLGCEWVIATPPISAIAASPCSARNGTSWELDVTLDAAVPATLAGLSATEFTLVTKLQNATLDPGEVVPARADGGRGYVCCGAVVSYVLPDVPYTHAPALTLNLTSGHVRAAFWRHGQCATPSVDVLGASCVGTCEMSWLTVYDEFYGAMEHTQTSYLQIPFGPAPWNYDATTTKRRGGDWYVSIWALPNMEAEFAMRVHALRPPRAPAVFECSRFDGFCPRDHYHAGYVASTTVETVDDGTVVMSAASARGAAGLASNHVLAGTLALLATVRVALFGRR